MRQTPIWGEVPIFRLIDETGQHLGDLTTPAVWKNGDTIPLKHHPGHVVVVRTIEPEPTDDYAGYLVVRPADERGSSSSSSSVASLDVG